MGRADTHLAACAITAALLLACANCAIAVADTSDSSGNANTNSTASDSDPAPSAHTAESKSTDENAKAADSQPAEAVQMKSIAAAESVAEEPNDDPVEKPVDRESCAENHHDKTITIVPVPEAPPAVELPEDVAPALNVAPPPVDLPPTVPASPVDPDTVDVTTGEANGNHPHGDDLPVLTVPFLVMPSMPAHILGASIAPRANFSAQSTPQWGNEPSTRLLRASASEPLPEAPPASGLAARGQTSEGYTYGYPSRSLAGMAAGAMPGVAGIVIMTAGGICLGYRQAKAQLALTGTADRFL
jgi:hypothetical protein